MADLSFATLAPESTDSPIILAGKFGVAWRGAAVAAESFEQGEGGEGFVGQEWDTDSNAPTHDIDADAPVASTD